MITYRRSPFKEFKGSFFAGIFRFSKSAGHPAVSFQGIISLFHQCWLYFTPYLSVTVLILKHINVGSEVLR